MKEFILALDQGTTSSRAIVFDHNGLPVAVAQKEFTQHYPKPGWVEHDPEEIWSTQSGVALEVIKKAEKGYSYLFNGESIGRKKEFEKSNKLQMYPKIWLLDACI